MPEMLSYIFSTLETSERAIRNQSRVNRNVAIFAVVMAACTYVHAKKIKSLELELEKLKNEGEKKEEE